MKPTALAHYEMCQKESLIAYEEATRLGMADEQAREYAAMSARAQAIEMSSRHWDACQDEYQALTQKIEAMRDMHYPCHAS